MSSRWTIYQQSGPPPDGKGPLGATDAAHGNIQRDIDQLAGTTLQAIHLEPFRVEFCFLKHEINILLSMQKSFSCNLGPEPFDPTQQYLSGRHADFIGLRGRACISVALSPNRLCLTFDTGDTLEMELSASDFEPFHLSGHSNTHPTEWLFYYVDPRA